ncbi:hypothetical protein BH18ACT5_BH18ACT5_16300 [soil metagenome]
MPTPSELSSALVDLLGLEHPPIAITFEEAVPTSNRFDQPPVSASCVFWMLAGEQTLTTVPNDHNCSVGRYTHGLAAAGDILDKEDVAALLDVGWVTMEAFAGVAQLSHRPAAISYGPLSEAGEVPDVALLRVNPRQMMTIADAVAVEFSGKPQCQILPRAAENGVIAASMGCALSRARTGMSDEELTCAVPGGRLTELVDSLKAVRRADDAITAYAVSR